MNKNKYYMVLISIISIIICFSVIFVSTYLLDFSKVDIIEYNKNSLEKLLKYKVISGEIIGLSPVDIDINNLFINNNSLTATSFHQATPSEKFKTKIISNGCNNYKIYQYLNGKNTGLYNLTLNGLTLNGTFTDYSNGKIYEFKSILTNYTNSLELSNSDTTHIHAMENIFLNYPMYKGKFVFKAIGKPNENITIEYNKFTNKIIEYSDNNPNIIVNLKIVKPQYNSGIALNTYYKNKYIGHFDLFYISNYSEWIGTYYKLYDGTKYAYPVNISAGY